MIKSTNYENIIRTVRTHILEQTGLISERVVNADSVRGADLSKILNEVDVMSIDLSDVFIVFELIEDNNDNNYIVPEDDASMSSLASFRFVLHIYGNQSHTIAQMIMCNMRLEDVVTDMHDKGIYLTGITYPENQKEFINETLWPRCDVDLNLQVRFNFKKSGEISYFNDDIDNIDMKVIKI